jgi:hypothetical protein
MTFQVLFISPPPLLKASLQRVVGKMNDPAAGGVIHVVRREGDSNPRYGYPYGSLANCWFKPLTHRSGLIRSQVSQSIISANRRTVQASHLSLLLLQQRGKNRKSLKITQTYYANCRIAMKTKSLFL